ncbi:AT-hook motif nuclear-localized protein 17-like [Magnolia sinica]|uniref:AT-hook motif nuclear-localized protein 17-like n=1 Tax=Magnolia sinica TaxID=86752 RepID=UPI00265AF738|nr:AT-hook motif nuclear-localized protein 17-like [Magnolia sinica]
MADYGGGAPAAAIALSHARDCHTSEEDEEEGRNSATGKNTKAMVVVGGAKKPRGRPPGSKNKPKPPIVITRDSESAMRPTVLELSAGSDVVESVLTFARRRHVSICVLSGSGSVANVTLRHPTSHASTLTLHGRFDILSLSGTFLCSPSPTTKAPFTISLAGAQGQVIGGTVAGALVAAGPVVLMVASFTNPSYHRLPAEEEEAEDNSKKAGVGGSDSGSSSNSMSMSVYSVAAPSPLTCQITSDVLAWAPPSRPPHY